MECTCCFFMYYYVDFSLEKSILAKRKHVSVQSQSRTTTTGDSSVRLTRNLCAIKTKFRLVSFHTLQQEIKINLMYTSFIIMLLRKAENCKKEGKKSNLRKHRREEITSNQGKKVKSRYCIVNIKFTYFILFITALKFKSQGKKANYSQNIFELCILKVCFTSKLINFPTSYNL